MTEEKIPVPQLKGVPETLLWPLYNRSVEARRADGLLRDPLAVKVSDQIHYPYAEHFGKPDEGAALRALAFDEKIQEFLVKHPYATVVALGDGLETEFWRVDNGKLKWLSVDLAETIELRQKLLPAHERQTNFICSALDTKWMEEVDASQGVFISAQGLMMYFKERDAAQLIAKCAKRFPGAQMMFDVVPKWISALTYRGWNLTKAYKTPAMPWGLDIQDLKNIRTYDPNIVGLEEIPFGRGRGFFFKRVVPIIKHLPFIGNKRPAMVLLTFGDKR